MIKLNNNKFKKDTEVFNIDQYENNGVFVCRNLFEKKKINKIKKELLKIISKKNKLKIRKRDINLVKNKVNSMHGLTRYNKYFKDLSKNNTLIKICEKALKRKPNFKEAEYFAKPKTIGLKSPFHQDNFYWNIIEGRALTVWVALDTTNKINGNLKYFLKSHKLGTIKHVSSMAPGSSQMISYNKIRQIKKKFKEISIDLKPGDAIVHSCEIIHGSEPNRSDYNRRGLTFQFIARGSKTDKIGKKRYLQSLYSQIKKRKKFN